MFRVMIAEDNPYMLDELCQCTDWERFDFDIVGTYPNGQVLMQAAEAAPPDVVFTDISMPIMDGMSLSSQLLQQNPDMKIVFISEHSEFEYARKALQLHIFDYVVKPVQKERIEEILKRLLFRLQQEQFQRFEQDQSRRQSSYFQRAAQSHYVSRLICRPDADAHIRAEFEKLGLQLDGKTRLYMVRYLAKAVTADAADFSSEHFQTILTVNFHGIQWIPMYSDYPDASEGEFLLLAHCNTESVSDALTNVCIDTEAQMGFSLSIGYSSASTQPAELPLLHEQAQKALFSLIRSDWSIPIISYSDVHVDSDHGQASVTPHKQYAASMKAFIDVNYMKPLTTNGVAQSVYLSPNYANSCFAQKYGMSIFNYISAVRLEKAKLLLKNTDEQITRIAELVGYGSKTSFYLAFKRSYGLSPTEYRLEEES